MGIADAQGLEQKEEAQGNNADVGVALAPGIPVEVHSSHVWDHTTVEGVVYQLDLHASLVFVACYSEHVHGRATIALETASA
jgi:hypothetical protein